MAAEGVRAGNGMSNIVCKEKFRPAARGRVFGKLRDECSLMHPSVVDIME